MKFSDNIERGGLDTVYAIIKESEFEQQDEFYSLLWDVERYNFLEKGQNLYSIPARALKIGQSIHDKNGKYVAYRSA